MDKLKKTKSNIVYGFVNKFVMMLGPFVVRSVIIYKLGIEYVGLGSLFSSILQVLSLAELGFGTAVVYSMYKPIAENDDEVLGALLYFYKRVYLIIGIVIFLIGNMITPILPSLIAGEYPDGIHIYILYYTYLLNTVLSYVLFGYKQSLLIANQRNDVESKISIVSNLFVYIVQVIILITISNYYVYTFLILMGTILLNVLRNIQVKKLFPNIGGKGVIDTNSKKEIYKRVYGLLLSNICQVCRNSFDSIILSAFLGLEILGQYQNYYYVMNAVTGFLHILTSSVLGGVGLNIATKSREDNYKQFRTIFFGYNLVSSWSVVFLLCLYQPFIELWVGANNMFPDLLVYLMCLYFYSLKIGDVVSLYKEATGIYWEDRYRPIAESIANLVLNVLLVKAFGVYGVVGSTIISIILINIPWASHTLFKVYFKMSNIGFYEDTLLYTLVLVFVSITTAYVCSYIEGSTAVIFIGRVFCCTVIPGILFILFFRENDRYYEMKKLLRKIVQK